MPHLFISAKGQIFDLERYKRNMVVAMICFSVACLGGGMGGGMGLGHIMTMKYLKDHPKTFCK